MMAGNVDDGWGDDDDLDLDDVGWEDDDDLFGKDVPEIEGKDADEDKHFGFPSSAPASACLVSSPVEAEASNGWEDHNLDEAIVQQDAKTTTVARNVQKHKNRPPPPAPPPPRPGALPTTRNSQNSNLVSIPFFKF